MEIIMNLGSMVIGLVAYVLMAVGLYTIAKRRGIRNSWLAWIPVANYWLLGCISDQYQYVAKGQNKSRRKLLLTLSIIVEVLCIVMIVLMVIWLVSVMSQTGMDQMGLEDWLYMSSMDPDSMEIYMESQLPMDYMVDEEQMIQTLLAGVLGLLGMLAVLLPLSIWMSVVYYMALYDLYSSADPKNATIYLVLSIVLGMLVGSILPSIFILVCKDKDDGMPPRRQPSRLDEITAQLPVIPEEPWQDSEE